MHALAQRVLSYIRRQELLQAGERVGVAVSGGIDSVALLRSMLELRGELGLVLSVVHFNHKLRGAESEADQEFVAGLARRFDLESYCDSDDVAGHARDEGISLEAAARELRYGFFRHLIRDGPQGLKPPVPDETSLRGAEALLFHSRAEDEALNCDPQRLKPQTLEASNGTAKAVPFPTPFYGAAEKRALSNLNKILTGHTLDDQAETVLMRAIRGAGLKGMGGIHPRILVEDGDGEVAGEIVRPLLGIRRRELEQYLGEIGQPWREDWTNAEDHFTRNRIRKLVMPLLEKEFNPAVAESLAELAEIARGEEDFWENEISGWLGTTVHWAEPEWAQAQAPLVQIGPAGDSGERDKEGRLALIAAQETRCGAVAPPGPSLDKKRLAQDDNPEPRSLAAQKALARDDKHEEGVASSIVRDHSSLREKIANAPWLVMDASVSRTWFLGEPVAVQRRIVKAIGESAGIPLEFKHVEEILRVATEESTATKDLSLPLGWKFERRADELIFITPDLREPQAAVDYEYELTIPGHIAVREAECTIEARLVPAEELAAYNPDHLLDADGLPGPLKVRNWRPGDRFWPVHTKSPKKIKELLQERHVAEAKRKSWPVVVSGDEIVWVRGFPAHARHRPKAGLSAVLILKTPFAAETE